MPNSVILLLVLGLALLAGAVYALHILARSRKPKTDLEYTFAWIGQPLSTFKYQPSVFAAIVIHTLAAGLLIPSAIRSLNNPSVPESLSVPPDAIIILLAWITNLGSAALIGFLAGVILAFPLSRLRLPPVHAGLTGAGITAGRVLIPWQSFSYFSVDESLHLVRFHSAFSPDLPALVLMAPPNMALADFSSALLKHLPSSPPSSPAKWYRARYMLPMFMLVISITVVWLAWIAAAFPRELALFTNVLLTWALTAAGGWLIGLFGFGRAFARRSDKAKPSAT